MSDTTSPTKEIQKVTETNGTTSTTKVIQEVSGTDGATLSTKEVQGGNETDERESELKTTPELRKEARTLRASTLAQRRRFVVRPTRSKISGKIRRLGKTISEKLNVVNPLCSGKEIVQEVAGN